jgi:hypothetical protein
MINRGAKIELISNCNIHHNGDSSKIHSGDRQKYYSGINLSHSDLGTVDGCTISYSGDKAVSTNSDRKNMSQPGCTIGMIKNCKIIGNKRSGIYIKPNCYLNGFVGNTCTNNACALVASGKTSSGTKGKSIIKNVSNNTISGSARIQIMSGDKGAVIYIGDKNKIINGKNSGLCAKKSGVIKVTGKGNLISKNKAAGFSVIDKGKLYITGKKTVISYNKTFGVYARNKSVTEIKKKNVKFIKNKKNKTYKTKKAKIKFK